MNFPASTPLTNTDAPASVGKRQAGKWMHWSGRECLFPLLSELWGFWTDVGQQHISGPNQPPLVYATQSSTFCFQTEGIKEETETSSPCWTYQPLPSSQETTKVVQAGHSAEQPAGHGQGGCLSFTQGFAGVALVTTLPFIFCFVHELLYNDSLF